MLARSALVGRGSERERLGDALRRATAGSGSIVLLAGEAGVGKTRLAEDVATASGARLLWGRATERATAPYGPIVAALRSHLRAHPDAFAGVGPLRPHLALVLPELGVAAAESDRATLCEALRGALAEVATSGPTVVVLDDLHWSDEATLDLLPAWSEPLAELPVLVVATYRSDGLARGHPLRRLRHELRRAGRLEEIVLEPLDAEETAALLADVLGDRPAPSLSQAIVNRTQGIPFFVEELGHALLLTGSVAPGRAAWSSPPSARCPCRTPSATRS
jgi:predicted ATPase